MCTRFSRLIHQQALISRPSHLSHFPCPSFHGSTHITHMPFQSPTHPLNLPILPNPPTVSFIYSLTQLSQCALNCLYHFSHLPFHSPVHPLTYLPTCSAYPSCLPKPPTILLIYSPMSHAGFPTQYIPMLAHCSLHTIHLIARLSKLTVSTHCTSLNIFSCNLPTPFFCHSTQPRTPLHSLLTKSIIWYPSNASYTFTHPDQLLTHQLIR